MCPRLCPFVFRQRLMNAAFYLCGVDLVDVSVRIFHGRFLRSHEFSKQNSETKRKGNASGPTVLHPWNNVCKGDFFRETVINWKGICS